MYFCKISGEEMKSARKRKRDKVCIIQTAMQKTVFHLFLFVLIYIIFVFIYFSQESEVQKESNESLIRNEEIVLHGKRDKYKRVSYLYVLT